MTKRENVLARAREINEAARAKEAEGREPVEQTVSRILMTTVDEYRHRGKEHTRLAWKQMLHRVCDGDTAKSLEAARLIKLFIVAALKEGET